MAEKRPRMPRPAAVGDLLGGIFEGKAAGKRLKEGKIWLIWESAVGERIASRARPSGFRNGILTVTVNSAPWMQQLTYLKRQIADKINKRLGEELVQDIFLRAGTNSEQAPAKAPTPRKARELTPEELQSLDEQAAAISDPELRTIVVSLMSRHLENH